LRSATSTAGFQHNLQQVHHVIVVYSHCNLGQQTVVPNVVKIASQINVYDAYLPLDDCLRHPVDRFMSCLLGTISKRARLEVGLEDRLQDEFERTLYYAVPDCRNRKDTDFTSVLRYFLPPGRQRLVGAAYKFIPDLLEESIYSMRFDGREGDAIYSGYTVVFFGQLIRFAQCFHLTNMDVQTPETPGRVSLRLDV